MGRRRRKGLVLCILFCCLAVFPRPLWLILLLAMGDWWNCYAMGLIYFSLCVLHIIDVAWSNSVFHYQLSGSWTVPLRCLRCQQDSASWPLLYKSFRTAVIFITTPSSWCSSCTPVSRCDLLFYINCKKCYLFLTSDYCDLAKLARAGKLHWSLPLHIGKFPKIILYVTFTICMKSTLLNILYILYININVIWLSWL